MKHLLKLKDLDQREILDILNLADQLKYETKHGIEHHHLKGKTLGMIFQKSSTRTRVSFETGMYQLGGQALFLSNRDLQIGRGEPVDKASGVPNKNKVATISKADVQKIAETKMPDLNAANLESAMSMIAGTARSMGIVVED